MTMSHQTSHLFACSPLVKQSPPNLSNENAQTTIVNQKSSFNHLRRRQLREEEKDGN